MSVKGVYLDDLFNFSIKKMGPLGEDLEGAAMRYSVSRIGGGDVFEMLPSDVY